MKAQSADDLVRQRTGPFEPRVKLEWRESVIPRWRDTGDSWMSFPAGRFARVRAGSWLVVAYQSGTSLHVGRTTGQMVTTYSVLLTGFPDRPFALSYHQPSNSTFLFYKDSGGLLRVRRSGDDGATWAAATTIWTPPGGTVLETLAASHSHVWWTESNGSGFKYVRSWYNGSVWSTPVYHVSSSYLLGECTGLAVAAVDEVSVYGLCTYVSPAGVNAVGRFGRQIPNVTGPGLFDVGYNTVFDAYLSTGDIWRWPSLSISTSDNRLYASVLRIGQNYDRPTPMSPPTWTTNTDGEIMFSWCRLDATYGMRQPMRTVAYNEGHAMPPIIELSTTGFGLASHRRRFIAERSDWLEYEPEGWAIQPLVAYTIEQADPGIWPGDGGGRLELVFNQHNLELDTQWLPRVGTEIRLSRSVNGSEFVGTGHWWVTSVEHVIVGENQALRIVRCQDGWFWLDAETEQRVGYGEDDALYGILGEISGRVFGLPGAYYDPVWDDIVENFVILRNERWRTAVLRLARTAGGRIEFDEDLGLIGVSIEPSLYLNTIFGYRDGDHPLLPGSWVADRFAPTVFEARGVESIRGTVTDYDAIAAGRPDFLVSVDDARVGRHTRAVDRAYYDSIRRGWRQRGGTLVIPPHLGLELNDAFNVVIGRLAEVYDPPQLDRAQVMRASAITEIYDTRGKGKWLQKVVVEGAI